MPEGPEIRLAADRVGRAVIGKQLVSVSFGLAKLKRFQAVLTGECITRVDTHGKAMLTRFSNGLTLYSHNQLYGRWYVTRGQPPATNRSLRVALRTATGCAFLYSASDIAVLNERQLADHPFLRRLGPDILSATAGDIEQQLLSPQFAGRGLGSVYLDQHFVAGIGNYLRSEILYFAGLHHALRPQQLGATARRRLARMTRATGRRSYRTRGVTNPDSLARRLRAEGLGSAQYRFAVFGRDGEPCHTCGSAIERAQVAGRRLYFCPTCQAA